MENNMLLQIKDLCFRYGTNQVLANVNLDVDAGQFVALVGPRGCGKSTLFKTILGTHRPSEGEVLLDGKPINEPTRNVGIVYQHYSLYDFLTTIQNVAFGPLLDGSTLPYRI